MANTFENQTITTTLGAAHVHSIISSKDDFFRGGVHDRTSKWGAHFVHDMTTGSSSTSTRLICKNMVGGHYK
jgi:hypothetical protein